MLGIKEAPSSFHEIILTVTVGAGVSVDCAVHDALLLALTENRIVEFKFNETPIRINPGAIVSNFVREWSAKRT